MKSTSTQNSEIDNHLFKIQNNQLIFLFYANDKTNTEKIQDLYIYIYLDTYLDLDLLRTF